jgi:hypothetical protein
MQRVISFPFTCIPGDVSRGQLWRDFVDTEKELLLIIRAQQTRLIFAQRRLLLRPCLIDPLNPSIVNHARMPS